MITVPGNDSNEARNLGQTARLYIRPVIHAIAAQQAAAARPGGQGGPPAGQPGAARRVQPAAPEAPRAPAEAGRARRQRPPGQGAGAAAAPPAEPDPPPESAADSAAAPVSGRRRRRAPAPPAPRTQAAAEQGPRAAHHRREGAAPEHRTADPDPGAAVPGDPLQRGRRPGRQRRSEPAAGDLLDRPHPGVSAGQVDHQRRADQERQFRHGHSSAASTSSTCEFKPDAANIWADFTAANVGTQTAFTLDSQVVSAPQIQEAIPGGRTQITGQFTADDAPRSWPTC